MPCWKPCPMKPFEDKPMKKKVLFIDRDGTLVLEPPVDYQLDAYEKLQFYPGVIRNLAFIRRKLDFEFALVTNQDGLGTPSFPEESSLLLLLQADNKSATNNMIRYL